MVTLKAGGPSTGRALLSYGTAVYERFAEGKTFDRSHVSAFKNYNISRTLLDLGFEVDVLDYDDALVKLSGSYDLMVDAGENLETLAGRLGNDCQKILCPAFGHWSIHNTGNYIRHRELIRRRGVALKPARLLRPNLCTELADHILCNGGDFGIKGYAYGKTPVSRIVQTVPFTHTEYINRSWDDVRNRFLWLAGAGPVHKGLDLALEAFAALPDAHLTVCGSFEKARDFEALYRRELYETPNINAIGWINTESPEFLELLHHTGGVVHASVSELGCGSVIAGMLAGLIPVGTVGNDVDVEGSGVLLREETVTGMQDAISELMQRPSTELERMSRAAWEQSHARYGQTQYVASLRSALSRVTGRPPPAVWDQNSLDLRVAEHIHVQASPR